MALAVDQALLQVGAGELFVVVPTVIGFLLVLPSTQSCEQQKTIL
jgi:hypothetical protein